MAKDPTMHDRRALLRGLGIGVPASLAIASSAEALPADLDPMTPQDVFEIYVSECLRCLPQHFAKDSRSNMRMLIEAQGVALAMVLARLQQK